MIRKDFICSNPFCINFLYHINKFIFLKHRKLGKKYNLMH